MAMIIVTITITMTIMAIIMTIIINTIAIITTIVIKKPLPEDLHRQFFMKTYRWPAGT